MTDTVKLIAAIVLLVWMVAFAVASLRDPASAVACPTGTTVVDGWTRCDVPQVTGVEWAP